MMKDRTNDNLDFRRGVIYGRQVLQDEREREREKERIQRRNGTQKRNEMAVPYRIKQRTLCFIYDLKLDESS